MRAIVNVSKTSAFSECNGHTYNVTEVLNGIIQLQVEDRKIDFSFDEIMVIDIDLEIKKLRNNIDIHHQYKHEHERVVKELITTRDNLIAFCKKRSIKLEAFKSTLQFIGHVNE